MEQLSHIDHLGDYINGEFIKVKRPEDTWETQSPADLSDRIIKVESYLTHVSQATVAAKNAYIGWAKKSLEERVECLMRLKEIYIEEADKVAELISRETGKPLWEAKTESAGLSAKINVTVVHSIRLVREEKIENALPSVNGFVRYKPRGVMCVVGPFNFPAHLANGHFIPALLMGNTVVFKPSEKTPATGQKIAEMFHRAGFPPGVFNLIQGRAEISRRLVVDENIDGVLFTGSYEVGLKIKQSTIDQYWKLIALEMGGKNSTIVWDDANLDKAIYESIVGSYLTTGQRCSCTSKIILHKNIRDKFLEKFHETAKKIKIGHWSENAFMGPLIDANSRDKYFRFQEIASREGAECLMRGKALDCSREGYYVTPSINIVNKFDPKSVYQNTEIFGPNVAIYTTDDFDEAIKIVNASGYGLVSALFTKSRDLYNAALLEARVGLLNWNRTTNGASSKLPFGGMDKSGNDRPSGDFAIQYCSVPVASLEDFTDLNREKIFPGISY